MKTVIHKSDTRGYANFGWLESRHSFSFGSYYNPDRERFGLLRVLNDDTVQAGMGFGTHPHSNMEIISIPLSGQLAHKDSMGNEKVIQTGEVQIMSAGKGISHSEYNYSKSDPVKFLQIWIYPKELNITPRYDQKFFNSEDRKNKLQHIISPINPEALWINQDAEVYLVDLDSKHSIEYVLLEEGFGVYAFLIEGEAQLNQITLEKRDGVGIYDTEKLKILAVKDSTILLMKLPMF